ncbi:hypothetical protein OP10G_3549 [Fimbriimonas ginsengisoli Gsoil 348]|uniref:Uncharacterized protein n=1 Tax=Fimbriimonas ginsengisoli Gsoil 348 TaxID=661478 RepID=A0A068NU72_FIMGI|nr:hypothetical protein OP10G_3549 [Fimbriimonas ginsengisoli Gsoil 348]
MYVPNEGEGVGGEGEGVPSGGPPLSGAASPPNPYGKAV